MFIWYGYFISLCVSTHALHASQACITFNIYYFNCAFLMLSRLTNSPWNSASFHFFLSKLASRTSRTVLYHFSLNWQARLLSFSLNWQPWPPPSSPRARQAPVCPIRRTFTATTTNRRRPRKTRWLSWTWIHLSSSNNSSNNSNNTRTHSSSNNISSSSRWERIPPRENVSVHASWLYWHIRSWCIVFDDFDNPTFD